MIVKALVSVKKVSMNVEIHNKYDPSPGIRDLVRGLMETLLEEHPSLLSGDVFINLMDPRYCKEELGLEIFSYALLRKKEEGIKVKGNNRYWAKVYADKYYVCSQWTPFTYNKRAYNAMNAKGMLRLIDILILKDLSHDGIPSLEMHRGKFNNYVDKVGG